MAKKKRRRIASRGSVNDIILKTLLNGDKYGYEIIKEVEEFSLGKIVLKQPSLYSSLSRFEEKGYVSSYWGDSDIGGRRHYYHLTDKGKEYYDEQNKPRIERELKPVSNMANHHTIFKTLPLVNNEYPIDTVKKDLTNDSNQQKNNDDYELLTEEVKEIPAIVDFDEKEEPEVIPDHDFHANTPIENYVEKIESQTDTIQEQTEISNIVDETKKDTIKVSQSIDDSKIWKELSNQVKLNNRKCARSPYKKLHYIKPKKSQIVILDSDGIYKLRDADYVPNKKEKKNKIIDNVGKRIATKNDGYVSYASSSKPAVSTPQPTKELTEEERKIRNENFLAKFNSLTKSRMKPVEPKPVYKEPEPKKEIDYRSKLDIFKNDDEEEPAEQEQEQEENNLFNYVDEEEPTEENRVESDIEEDEEDNFINFDPVEFETKKEDKKYIEEINNYQANHDEIKISKYENRSNAILSDKTYILINKAKCLFGFILLMLLAIEITASLFIFKNNGLITGNDKILFIAAYVLSLIISLAFILPVCFNPREHKLNNFRLKYSVILGCLTFLVSIILVYCINALAGFQLDNFRYFAVKLILPLILTFNFVITPPIYALIIKSKLFYD